MLRQGRRLKRRAAFGNTEGGDRRRPAGGRRVWRVSWCQGGNRRRGNPPAHSGFHGPALYRGQVVDAQRGWQGEGHQQARRRQGPQGREGPLGQAVQGQPAQHRHRQNPSSAYLFPLRKTRIQRSKSLWNPSCASPHPNQSVMDSARFFNLLLFRTVTQYSESVPVSSRSQSLS